MKRHIYAPSYERGLELQAAGCPMEYLNALPRTALELELLPYFPSCVYPKSPNDTRWLSVFRLSTESPSGTHIIQWSLKLEDKDHEIAWGCELREVIPKDYLDVYKPLCDARLRAVLNGRLLRYGHPVAGVLCGLSLHPIGNSSNACISAHLSLTDDFGNRVSHLIEFDVHAPRPRLSTGTARQRVFKDGLDLSGQLGSTIACSESGLAPGELDVVCPTVFDAR